MKTLICSARDCAKSFKSIMPHAKFCSDACRWREAKRKQVKEREAQGLCPQCGGEMTPPKNLKERAPNYCIKCQKYFQKIYIKKSEKDD